VPRKRHPVRTHWSLMPGDKYSGNLFTGCAAGVIEET